MLSCIPLSFLRSKLLSHNLSQPCWFQRSWKTYVLAILLVLGKVHGQSLTLEPTVRTAAGTGISASNGNGGFATSAALVQPDGVAFDAAGNVYVADAGANVIRKIDVNGRISTFAGTGTPCGSAAACGDGGQASNANLYAGELATDSKNLYLTDYTANRIRKINLLTGVITSVIGTGNVTPLNTNVQASQVNIYHPDGIVLDPAGDIYFSDSNHSLLYKYTAGTGLVKILNSTAGLGLSGDGGQVANAQLNNNLGIAIDSAGDLFVADQYNNRIREITPSGVITTVVGTTAGFSGDGAAAGLAQLNGPRDVAFDAQGNLYILDRGNRRVRVVTAVNGSVTSNSLISTYAGNGGQCTGNANCGDNGVATGASFSNFVNTLSFNAVNRSLYISDVDDSRVRQLLPYPLFPPVEVGSSVTQTVAVQVTGAPLSISSISASPGPNGSQEFTVGTGTGCVTGGSFLLLGTVCQVQVTFAPSFPGTRKASLQFGTSAGQIVFGMTGTGLGPQVLLISGPISTVAGNGIAGSTGNGGVATSAELSSPRRIAVDSAGNIYIADQANNTIRKVAAGTGIVTTIAGNGTACSGPSSACGDGGPATSAQLNSPSSVALDSAGNVYIADRADNRIRFVSASTGYISTFAGTGAASYTGDGTLATAATLSAPRGIFIDQNNDVYVADTTNQAIRKVDGGTGIITTVAGTGTACSSSTSPCGDGGTATAAQLNSPSSIVLDRYRNLYVADSADNRVREVNPISGLIATVAGTGTAAYTGDGGTATSATLNAPADLAADSAGDIYIADTNNNVIRLLDNQTSTISTLAGIGTPCSSSTAICGDGGHATAAMLTAPRGVALDSVGNIYVSDTGDNRIREISNFNLNLSFASTPIGSTSTDSPQTVTLYDIGTDTLIFPPPTMGGNPTISSGFNLSNSSSCPQLTSSSSQASQVSGAVCKYQVNFSPSVVGTYSGSMIVTDNALNGTSGQTITLNGTGTKITDSAVLTTSNQSPNYGQSITLSDSLPAQNGYVPSGTVTFMNGSTTLGSATLNSSGVATLTTALLPVGTDTITAVYPGDSNFNGNTSNAVVETVGKTMAPDALSASPTSSNYGQSVTLTNALSSVNGMYPTGTVTFYDGSMVIGTGTLNNSGVASLSTATLPAGSNSITAQYAGDNNFAGETSPAVTVTVAKLMGTNTLTTSQTTIAYGQPVTLTDTLSSAFGLTPTGSVAFYSGSTSLGTGTVNAFGVATVTTNQLPLGTDSVTAVYGGDPTFQTTTSNSVNETVGSPATMATSTTLTSSVNPSTYGQNTTFTSNVISSGGGIPTGMVTFYAPGAATLVNLDATVTNPATQTLNLPAGTYSVSVVGVSGGGLYDGWNPAYNPSSNNLWTDRYGIELCPACANLVNAVAGNPGGSTAAAAFSSFQTATTLNEGGPSGTQQVVNNPYTFTLTSPTSVTLFVPDVGSYGDDTGGLSLAVTPLTQLGTAVLDGTGSATYSISTLPIGNDQVLAIYSGDNTYVASSSGTLTQVVNKANAVTTLTTSNATPGFGQSVTLTDTIQAVNGVAPTGTVTFYDGSTALGTGIVNASGIATQSTNALPVGTDAITAVYGGDSNYAQVTSNAVTETVGKTAGPDTLSTSNASPGLGQSVTFNDSIPIVNGVAPTGTVTFYNGSMVLGTGTVGSGVATLMTSALPVGTDSITAVYAGDSNYAQVTSNPVTEMVGRAAGSDTLTSSNASPTFGQFVTLTDTIPTANGVTPTGTVTFYSGNTTIGTGSVNTSGVSTLATGSLPAGSDTITAVYGGDSNYAQVTSNAVTETVGKAAGADTLTTSNASPSFGQAVTLTDTIPVVNGLTPTGTVTFYNGSLAIGTGTVGASGVATLTTSALPIGTDVITAVFGGDSSYAQVTSNSLNEMVGKAAGADTLSTSNGSPNFGQSVTLTDSIPGVNGVAPTGAVTFYSGATSLGTGAVNGSGVAALTTGALPVGTDSITAIYGGDANYTQTTSNAITENVGKAVGADTLTVSSTTPTYGQSITLTDTIPSLNGISPTGTVTFYNGSTVIGSGTVNASGVATLATGSLPVGPDSITAVYAGDANYGQATTNAVTVTVGKSGGSPTLTSSNAAPDFGQPVTFTDTISTVNGVAPTGTVTFYSGSTSLGTGTLNASGAATVITGALGVGTDTVTAVYGGDANYAQATSNSVTETVAKANGADTLTSSDASPAAGQSITFTDTIPLINGIAPTGTVHFYNGTMLLGSGTVNASGMATLTVGSLPTGTDSITAIYGGDANYASVTAGPISENVAKSKTTDTLTSSNLSPNLGQSVILTLQIPAGSGAPPTGTVSFFTGTTLLGTGALDNSGTATLSTTALPAGSNSVTASYPGDTNYLSSNGGPLIETVAKSSAADTLTTSNTTPSFGQSVTLTDMIPAVNGFTPTGTVTFYNGVTVLGMGTVNASGVATLATGALPVGMDSITAVYGGDTNYGQVTSNALSITVGKSAGNSMLTTSNATPTSGQSVTFTDTLEVSNGVAPTGTVTFYNGTTTIGTATPNTSGVATLTTTSLPVGTDSVTAVSAGNQSYSTSTSNVVTETVGKSSGNGTLTASTASPMYGQPVTLTDTLPVVNGVAPSGTVTFYNGATAIGTGSINASGAAMLTTGLLPVGANSITAAFPGDANYGQENSNAVTITVDRSSGNSTLTTSNAAPTYGQTLTFTDTIPIVNAIAPTGTVTFYNGSTAIGKGTLNGSGVATLSTSSLPVGTNAITAVFAGDTNYSLETSNAVTEMVGKANASTLTTSNASPSSGQSVTFTETIPVVNGAGATGIVTFSNGANVLGTGSLNDGVATLITASLPVGTDPITASYPGDANYAQVSNTVVETVGKSGTRSTLVSSNAAPSRGQAVTFTDTVPTVNGVAPTGTVTFYNGTAVLGTGTLNASGVAILTTGSLPVGTDDINAVYGGDANYAQEISNAVAETVGKGSGNSTLTSSDSSPMLGQPITFTDTVPTVNDVPPTGTVTFYNGATAIGTGTLNGSGVATLTTGSLPVGLNTVTAVYGGDTNYAQETSNPVAETVGKGNSSSTLTSSNSSPNPGQSVTLTDTIATVNGITPTGTVTFYNGATAIGTGTLNASGVATLTTGSIPVGTNTATAVYGGDTNYTQETSNPVTETVAKIAASSALTTSNASPAYGQPATLTDTIQVVDGLVPTGTVTFYSGGTPLGTGTLTAAGTATLTAVALPVGTDAVTAVYAGDANYAQTTSNSVNETVTQATLTSMLTSSNVAITFGQSVTLTDRVSTPLSVAPTGTVTFYSGSTALGTGTLNASAVATLTTGSLPIGTDSVTAVYGGDTQFGTSTTEPVAITVNKLLSVQALSASLTSVPQGGIVTLTSAILIVGSTPPTGTVTFFSGGVVIGTSKVNASGLATLTTTSLPVGADQISATYAGDALYGSSTAGPVTVTVAPPPPDFSIIATPANQAINPGLATTYTVTLTDINAPLNAPITLTATGLPPQATVAFLPATVDPGTGAASTKMTIQTASNQASLKQEDGKSDISLALLLLPALGFKRVRRRLSTLPRGLLYAIAGLGLLGAMGSLTGCGGGYFGLPPHSYTVTIIGVSQQLQHSTTVTLTIE